MTIFNILHDMVFDYTLRSVSLGACILGLTSGALGSYAFLRRQSLLGDTISHAALPGIAVAFLITGSKASLVIMIGAIIAGLLGTIFMNVVIKMTRIKTDSSLGLVLSVFFGLGIVLLTFIQRMPEASKAGLDKYLFGQAATMMQKDIIVMAVLGGLALLIMLVFWKEFKILIFDHGFGESIGFPMRTLDLTLTFLIVIAIIIGLQAVGVVLMSAMLVAPAAAARMWTDKLGTMVFLAGLFGAISGVAGAVISSLVTKLPTGPTIVLCITAIVVYSIFFASKHGVIQKRIKRRQFAYQLAIDRVLKNFYLLASHHDDLKHVHSIKVLETMLGQDIDLRRSLMTLKSLGYIEQYEKLSFGLTDKGILKAREYEAASMAKGGAV